MTIVPSGIISLGGIVQSSGLNESIEYELYQNGKGYNGSGNATISLNDAAVRTLAGIPSGPISFADLYGKTAFSPTLHIHTTTGSGTETIPVGAATMVIEVWGGGGGAGIGTKTGASTGGGGAGGYSRSSYNVIGYSGQTINYTVGAGGTGITDGLASNVSSNSYTLTTMQGYGGTHSPNSATLTGAGGNGGSATGGNQANYNGMSGDAADGAGGVGGEGTTGSVAGDGSPYGKGADGSTYPSPATSGYNGAVVFYYT